MAEQYAKLLQHLRRQRRRAGDNNRMRCRFLRVSSAGVSSSRTYIVGTPKKSVGSKSRNVAAAGLMLEALQQPHPAPADQPAMQPVAQRVDVKQRQSQQERSRSVICQHAIRSTRSPRSCCA